MKIQGSYENENLGVLRKWKFRGLTQMKIQEEYGKF